MTENQNARGWGLVFLLCGALLFLACVTTMASLSQADRDQIQTRSYNLPDSVIFSAVLSTIANEGYSIQVSDKSSGFIQTEPLMDIPNGLADFMTGVLAGIKGRSRNRVSALVKNGTVKLNYIFETEIKSDDFFGGASGWEPAQVSVTQASSVYSKTFSDIDKALGR